MNSSAYKIYAPELTSYFVPRHKIHNDIIHSLQFDKNMLIGLVGAGGYGKTTIAQSICYDTRISHIFPDGIYWITLGRSPNILDSTAKLLVELTGVRDQFIDIEDASQQLSIVLANKKALIVIDDLWNNYDLNPFLRGGKECVRLVTTRNALSLPLDCLKFTIEEMNNDEALTLLTNGFGISSEDLLIKVHQLTNKMNNWPLLLKLANSMIRLRLEGIKSITESIEYVEQALARKGFVAFDFRNTSDRNQAAAITLQLSIDQLNDFEKARFFELSAFQEDTQIPIAIIEKLWERTGGIDQFDVDSLIRDFYALSLVQRVNWSNKTIMLHDEMVNFIKTYSTDNLQNTHSNIIDALNIDDWETSDKDQYFWDNIFYHLINAGFHEKINELAFSYSWIKRKITNTNPNSLINDLKYLHSTSANLLKETITLSAHILAHDPDQLSTQLWGRLSGQNDETLQRLIKQILREEKRPWLKTRSHNLTPPGGPLQRTLQGHTGIITCLHYDAKSDVLFSGDLEGKLIIWDFRNGLEKGRYDFGLSNIFYIGVLSSNLLVLASKSHIKLVDISNIQKIETKGEFDFSDSEKITSLAVSGSQNVYLGFENGTIKDINIVTGQLNNEFHHFDTSISAIKYCIAKNESLLIYGNAEGKIYIKKLFSTEDILTLNGHRHEVTDLLFSEGRNSFFSCSRDTEIIEWDLSTFQQINTYSGHSKGVNKITLLESKKLLISSSEDKTIRLWNIADGNFVIFPGHTREVMPIICIENLLVSGSSDNTIKIWDMEKQNQIDKTSLHSNWIWSVAFCEDDSSVMIASGSADRYIKFTDFKDNSEILSINAHSAPINAVAYSPSLRCLISGGLDNKVKVWDIKDGHQICTLNDHRDWVFGVSFSRDNKYALSVSRNGQICIWETSKWNLLRSINGIDNVINSVVVSNDNNIIFGASWDKSIKLWDFQTGDLLGNLNGHKDLVVQVATIPNTTKIISASYDNTLIIWDYVKQSQTAVLTGHRDRVNAVAVNKKGDRAISASHDHSIIVWDLINFQKLAAFSGDSTFRACAISESGNYFVAGSALGRLHLLEWNSEYE